MSKTEQLRIKKKLFPKIKIQNFEFEVPQTKLFNINQNFLAGIYLYIILQTFYTIGYAI